VSEKEILLKIKNLKKHFKVGDNQTLKAVDGLNFNIYRGETLGLVGESGCGKTTCGRTIMGIYKPTDGSVEFNGVDITRLSKKERRAFSKKSQMIFQDPYSSLNPRMLVGNIIGEGIDVHNLSTGDERKSRIHELLKLVGLNEEHVNRFPHEFSGGQRQRIGIARALAVNPEFIVCDEPISALDVSVQAQVVNLLQDLQKDFGLTFLFIAHDLSMVRYISDRVAVMYLGSLMEVAESNVLYDEPLHPYTQSLLSAIPIPDPKIQENRERIVLKGDVPSPVNPPEGCKFCDRCPKAIKKCFTIPPEFEEKLPGRVVACHIVERK